MVKNKVFSGPKIEHHLRVSLPSSTRKASFIHQCVKRLFIPIYTKLTTRNNNYMTKSIRN